MCAYLAGCPGGGVGRRDCFPPPDRWRPRSLRLPRPGRGSVPGCGSRPATGGVVGSGRTPGVAGRAGPGRAVRGRRLRRKVPGRVRARRNTRSPPNRPRGGPGRSPGPARIRPGWPGSLRAGRRPGGRDRQIRHGCRSRSGGRRALGGYPPAAERLTKAIRLRGLTPAGPGPRRLEAGPCRWSAAARPCWAPGTTRGRRAHRGGVATGVGSRADVPLRRRGEGNAGATRPSAIPRRRQEMKLPGALAHLANAARPVRLDCTAGPRTGATRSPRRPPPVPSATTSATTPCADAGTSTRHWKAVPAPAPSLDQLRAAPVPRVDLNNGHLSRWRASGPTGTTGEAHDDPGRAWPGCPPRNQQRAAARRHQLAEPARPPQLKAARAIVIEDLDFNDAREAGTRARWQPARARQARTGLPAAGLRHPHRESSENGLVQMAANAGISVIDDRPGLYLPLGPQSTGSPHCSSRLPRIPASGHHAAASGDRAGVRSATGRGDGVTGCGATSSRQPGSCPPSNP